MSTEPIKIPRSNNKWVEVRNSEIHGTGIFAKRDIPNESQVLEYLGEHIDKEESERRAWAQIDLAKETGCAGVYIFTLDEEWDIDGNFPWNEARLVNHSCDPNCETWVEEDQILFYAKKDIKEGEELSINYGFSHETYEDHPCRCGSDRCVGYIVTEDEWPQLKEVLEAIETE